MAENKKRKQAASDDDFSEYDDAYTVKEEDMAGFSRRSGKKRGEKSEGEKSEGQKNGTDHARKTGTHGAESSRGASSQGEKGHAEAEGKRRKSVNPSSVGNQIMIAVLAALAVFIVICFAAAEKVGIIGGFISEFLPGLFGGAALLIPIMLLIHALYWKRDAAGGTRLFRVMFSFAVTLFFSVVLHVIFAAAGSVPVEGKMGI